MNIDLSCPQKLHVPDTKVYLTLIDWKMPAGFPSPAADHTQERVDLNELLIHNKNSTFLFEVTGESMNGIGIYGGDLLIVDRLIEAEHGSIVVAVVNGEFTVKRLHRKGGVVKLVPENHIFPVKVMKPGEELVIWGVVKHSIRNH